MKAAVRYYSRGGNVKAMAEAFARGAQVDALSIDDPLSPIEEQVDVLFIGGALYAYHLDEALVRYLDSIPEGLVSRAVCFGSSFLTRRPIYLIQEHLKKRGITIVPQAVYSRNKPKQTLLDACEYFAATEMERDTSLDGLSPYERFRAMRIATGDASLEEELADLEGDSQHNDERATNDTEIADASDGGATPLPLPESDKTQGQLLINVDGINDAFKDKVIEIVEGIPNVGLKRVDIPATPASSLVFACSDELDIDDMVPLIKSTLKVSELGSIMLFRVTPHGEVMWVPKKK